MRRNIKFIGTSLLASILFLSASAQSQSAAPAQQLDARIRAEIAKFRGKVMLFARNLDTGATYGLSEDQRVRTASTIKVPIMVEAFAQVSEGRVKWTRELLLTNKKKVGGSGVTEELSEGLKLTLRDAVTLMIILSDNTATNLVLDAITTDAVNKRMSSLGFKNTLLLRKVFGGGDSEAGRDPANKPFGLGISTPREMVMLLEKLERGEVISPAASKDMISILKRQQYHEGIGRTLNGVDMATKPGALDHLRSDVGIIYSPKGRIAMAITCDDMPEIDWTVDNPAQLLMSRLSLLLIDGLGK